MENSVTEIAALATQAVGPQTVSGNPFLSLPPGYAVHDLEKMLPTPTRRRGRVALRDMESFCRMVDEQGDDHTRLYGTYDPPSFTAIFNDHLKDAPGWRDHSATYACPLSVEWKTWTGSNKKQMSQVDFAQFIEDNAPDMVTPDSASMIEIARTLEAKKQVNFASGVRLDNGETQFTFEETVQGTAGKGRFAIPETFTIAIQVFEGMGVAKNQIRARLRYRISNEGKLTLWYDLDRPHKDLEAAVLDVWAGIEAATGRKIFNGG